MINWIQPACKSPPAESMLLKSLSSESEASSSPSFGEILKAKEKKELKELENGAFPAAAAQAVFVRAPHADTPSASSEARSQGNEIGGVSATSSARLEEAQQAASRKSSAGAAQSQSDTEQAEAGKLAETQVATRATAADSAAAKGPMTGQAAQQSATEIQQAQAAVVATNAAALKSATEVQVPQAAAVPVAVVVDVETVAPQAATAAVVADVEMVAPQSSAAAAQAALSAAEPSMATDTAQSVAPVDAKQKLTDMKAATGNNPEAMESASSPAVPASGLMAPTAIPTSASAIANVQTTPEVLKSSSTSSANDKTISLEKQPESNPTLAALSTPASLAVEPAENKLPGKWSTPQINTQAGEVVQQVMRQMNATLQSGPSSMRLHLNPKELGVIDVQMIQSAQGVSVTFFAEQASTGRLLETQMNQLRQSLTDSGIQLSNLNIGQHGQPGQQGGASKQGLPFAQYPNSGTARPETQAEIDSRLEPERIAGQLQGVDYRI